MKRIGILMMAGIFGVGVLAGSAGASALDEDASNAVIDGAEISPSPAANVSVTTPHGGQQTGQQVSPEARSDSPASETEADELGSSSSFLEGILGPMDREARESGNLISLNDVMQQVSPEDRSDSPASVSVADELGSSSSFLEGIFGPMAPRVEGSGNLISLNDVMLKISPEARGDSSASEAEADELAFLEGILGPMPPEARKNYEETMRKLREKIVLGSRGYEEE